MFACQGAERALEGGGHGRGGVGEVMDERGRRRRQVLLCLRAPSSTARMLPAIQPCSGRSWGNASGRRKSESTGMSATAASEPRYAACDVRALAASPKPPQLRETHVEPARLTDIENENCLLSIETEHTAPYLSFL